MNRGLCFFVLGGLSAMGFVSAGNGQNVSTSFEQLLKASNIPSDNQGLLEYFRHRSLQVGDGEILEKLIIDLDSIAYKEREEASRKLAARGPVALPFLKEVLAKNKSLEATRRSAEIIKKIEAGISPEQTAAAARLLSLRGVPGAAEVLFNYLPQVNDDWVLEEVFVCLGTLCVQPPRIDPVLKDNLYDKEAWRRAAAVYVLGRRGDLDMRETVRSFLGDADERVRRRAAESLVGKRAALNYHDLEADDEKYLKGLGFSTDDPSLLGILRKRTLDEEDQKRLRKLIADLGSPSFPARNRASRLLVKEGSSALAHLKLALHDADPEVVRRAKLGIEEIRRGPGPALPTAAVRLLARPHGKEARSPAAAIRVLLGYVPFADDEAVEEEVYNALALLSTREVRIDPLLPEALRDPLEARRSAAALVLGRVGTKEHRAGMRKLLEDPAPLVRLRAAQGLLLGKERTALPTMVALLKDAPPTSLWQVEAMLQVLSGSQGPIESVGEGTPEKRQLAFKAWEKWLAMNGSGVDLSLLTEGETHLGLMTVCEYDSAIGRPGGQVWESGRDGKERWKITGLNGAMDAQVLPNGRVLIAENSANRVTERDLNGNIKWEFRTPGNPIACQRLPNGNTFIAMYNQVMEITPDQRQVYLTSRGNQFYIFSARKTREGQVVAMTAQGTILRFDPLTDKNFPSIQLGPNVGWCSVESLPNGKYLVATMNNGLVREIDATGQVSWSITMPGAFRATRLPNGNTIVASMTTRLVAEFDRAGNRRWEKTCEGRPWSVKYR